MKNSKEDDKFWADPDISGYKDFFKDDADNKKVDYDDVHNMKNDKENTSKKKSVISQ